MTRFKYSLLVLTAAFAVTSVGSILFAMVTGHINMVHMLVLLICALLSSFSLNFHLKTLKLYRPSAGNNEQSSDAQKGISHHLWISPIILGIACLYLGASHGHIFIQALLKLNFSGNALMSLGLLFVFLYFGVSTFIDLRRTNSLIALVGK